LPLGLVERAEAAIGVGLQDAGPAGEMALGMLAAAIAGVFEERRRRPAAERPVVADVGPEPAGGGPGLGQHRHRGVVAVQALGGENVGLDEGVQWRQRHRAGADLIGEGREAELDAHRSAGSGTIRLRSNRGQETAEARA
jgi:hypothetical protein